MGGFADHLESGVIGQVFGSASHNYADPRTSYYIGLASASIDEDGDNLATIEPSDGSYARVNYPNNTSTAGWLVDGSSSENRAVITFSTATGGWGTMTHYFISRHLTATTGLLVVGALTSPKTILTGNIASFASGAISVSLN